MTVGHCQRYQHDEPPLPKTWAQQFEIEEKTTASAATREVPGPIRSRDVQHDIPASTLLLLSTKSCDERSVVLLRLSSPGAVPDQRRTGVSPFLFFTLSLAPLYASSSITIFHPSIGGDM